MSRGAEQQNGRKWPCGSDALERCDGAILEALTELDDALNGVDAIPKHIETAKLTAVKAAEQAQGKCMLVGHDVKASTVGAAVYLSEVSFVCGSTAATALPPSSPISLSRRLPGAGKVHVSGP